MKKPLCIDLFAGLGGWADGFLAEGYDVVGFDIERHQYGEEKYPAQLVLQDVLTLHGSQFRNAAVIVASPPCQEYSYMAMPWKLAKAKAAWYREVPMRQLELNCLLNACFRIAHQAGVPLVVENVCGAQPWIGRARANYGSFYLWGDVPALIPYAKAFSATKVPSEEGRRTDPGKGARFTTRDCGNEKGFAKEWRDSPNGMPMMSSKSPARKAASAQIAKIPFPLAQHIARVFKPAEILCG